MRGLTKRHPIVVSKISALRLNAASAFGMTKGARDMDSTPPAMIDLRLAADECARAAPPHRDPNRTGG